MTRIRSLLLSLVTTSLLCFGVVPALQAQAEDKAPLLGGSFLDILEKGGIVMGLILLGSIVGLAMALERIVALRRARLLPAALIRDLREATETGQVEDVERLVKDREEPLARILSAGLSHRHLGPQDVERVMETAGGREVARLKGPVRPLAVLATIEPLLGLLGTVLGMIGTFNVLNSTSAAERVERLAPGIGQALYTTVGGLCAAIPFVILYHFLVGRVNRAADEWSALGSDLVLKLSRPGAGAGPT
jgi:biopolymer transport protein ExbB